jgi:hypothetical protein
VTFLGFLAAPRYFRGVVWCIPFGREMLPCLIARVGGFGWKSGLFAGALLRG